jgi:hypothetical protein
LQSRYILKDRRTWWVFGDMGIEQDRLHLCMRRPPDEGIFAPITGNGRVGWRRHPSRGLVAPGERCTPGSVLRTARSRDRRRRCGIGKGLYVADLQHLFTIRISDCCRTRTLTLDCLPARGEAICEPMPPCESRCPSTTHRCVARSCRLISAPVGSPGHGIGVCADGA